MTEQLKEAEEILKSYQKRFSIPTDRDIAIEIVSRFLANPHSHQKANYEKEKKAFANGAIWMREKIEPLLAKYSETPGE